jgi:hypothetical protein
VTGFFAYSATHLTDCSLYHLYPNHYHIKFIPLYQSSSKPIVCHLVPCLWLCAAPSLGSLPPFAIPHSFDALCPMLYCLWSCAPPPPPPCRPLPMPMPMHQLTPRSSPENNLLVMCKTCRPRAMYNLIWFCYVITLSIYHDCHADDCFYIVNSDLLAAAQPLNNAAIVLRTCFLVAGLPGLGVAH